MANEVDVNKLLEQQRQLHDLGSELIIRINDEIAEQEDRIKKLETVNKTFLRARAKVDEIAHLMTNGIQND